MKSCFGMPYLRKNDVGTEDPRIVCQVNSRVELIIKETALPEYNDNEGETLLFVIFQFNNLFFLA